jgi:hypothetical protein
MRTRYWLPAASMALALAASAVVSVPAFALTPYDAPTLSCVGSGENEITIRVTAGASGAPAGVTIQWEPKDLFDAVGWVDDDRLCKLSLSGQPSLQHPGASRWELGSGESEEIKIGDINFDETGVSGENCGVNPLDCGTDYVFRAFAHAGRGFGRSDWSADVVCSTQPCPTQECTFTQGYWKNHGPTGCASGNNTNAWPVTSLTLGSVGYTDLDLCSILQNSASGNGLVFLAHQLIAAKLNVASGAQCPAAASAIAAADALIGNLVVPPIGGGFLSPGTTSGLTNTLDDFNNGVLAGCSAHCTSGSVKFDSLVPTPTRDMSWGGVKSHYR